MAYFPLNFCFTARSSCPPVDISFAVNSRSSRPNYKQQTAIKLAKTSIESVNSRKEDFLSRQPYVNMCRLLFAVEARQSKINGYVPDRARRTRLEAGKSSFSCKLMQKNYSPPHITACSAHFSFSFSGLSSASEISFSSSAWLYLRAPALLCRRKNLSFQEGNSSLLSFSTAIIIASICSLNDYSSG